MDLERAYYQGEPHLLPEGLALRLPIFCLWTGLQATRDPPQSLSQGVPHQHHLQPI